MLVRSTLIGFALPGMILTGPSLGRALLLRAGGQRQCEKDSDETDISHSTFRVVRLASLNDNSIVPHWGITQARRL